MKLLITAATDNELLAAREAAAATPHTVDFALTGIGIAPTTYHLTKYLLLETCDMVMNVGLAGSFTDRCPVGSVVCPVTEYFGDSGVQSPAGITSLFDEQLLSENTFPFVNGALKNNVPEKLTGLLPRYLPVRGVTSQLASGALPRIEELWQRFHPDIETMEGAAFFYVCLSQKVPFVALRAISNRVEVRNKEKWNIPMALEHLKPAIREVLSNL
jgi:futalosine hydrolase